MARIEAIVQDPNNIRVTVTATMTLKEWGQITSQVEDRSDATWYFLEAIQRARENLYASVTHQIVEKNHES